MQESYNIYFAGDIADGESLDEVRRKVGALFNAREATLDKLFSGKRQLIKRNCSEDEAVKYQSAMRRAGALATITLATADAKTDSAAQAAHIAAAATSTAPAGPTPSELALAPEGTDVLRPTERRTAPARHIDLSAFSVADVGEHLGFSAPQAPPPPDTSHLTMADIGDRIPGLPATPTPPVPDTLSLTLAEPNRELLDERYREHATPPPPDTDHLSVEPRHDD